MTLLQQLYFETGQREKLLDLSYRKIQQAQGNSTKNESYFHALALLDLANIHEALGELDLALQKIEGSIGRRPVTQQFSKAVLKNLRS
jgi:hypothetical protein